MIDDYRFDTAWQNARDRHEVAGPDYGHIRQVWIDAGEPRNAAAFIEQHMKDAPAEWVVVETLAPFDVNPRKYPVDGADQPMTRAAAWAALARIERMEPERDLSICKTAKIIAFKRTAAPGTGPESKKKQAG